ncbi:MAG TPA: formate dehydrogenase subunit alpha [bacterium]|nr:formate dehydrogenase subunit alpha [bacterium]HNB08768.1 formate dehydrogenase subunit alpha [bacterium]
MIKFTINGRTHEVSEGTRILEAASSVGIQIPTLCHDPRLNPSGVCRLCLVEIEGSSKPVPACRTEITSDMHIETHSAHIEKYRTDLLKMLHARYPQEVVEAFPEKELHRLFQHYVPRFEEPVTVKSSWKDTTHPYIRIDMSLCVDCHRCERICSEVQGQFVWNPIQRGFATTMTPEGRPTLLESGCVSCGACADTCPSGALIDKNVFMLGEPTSWTKTTCPYCGVGCEMMVGTRDQKIVTVKPSMDGPVNKGHLCVKGRYSHGFVGSGDRITEPMIRRDGAWQKVSWDEAYAFTASELKRISANYGASSVGVIGSARATNEDNYLTQKFTRVVLQTNNVDSCARVCHAPSAKALGNILGTGAATNAFDDIERATTIFICGANATENHPIVGARIKQAALRGAHLIVMDPRVIELAEYADIHLAVRPGANVALLNAMACTVIEEGLTDDEFILAHVSGYEKLREFLKDFTPEKIADQCGVDAATIRQAARLYATAKPAMCMHGLGMTEHTQGTDSVSGLINLALITGNMGKPGTGVNPLRGQNNVQGSAHMGCEPTHLTGYGTVDEGRTLFEATWKVSLPTDKGLNLMHMLDAAEKNQFKAMWIVGYDVYMTNPDTDFSRRAFENMELVVIQDMFMNETARLFGTVFLPCTSSFEKDGTFMNGERRVQRVRKAIEPCGQSKPDWLIICELAHAMGVREGFEFESAEDVWNEIRRVWKAGYGITYPKLEKGGIQWPCPTEDHPGTDILHRTTFPVGARAEVQMLPFSAPHYDARYPWTLITGRSLFHFNSGTMTGRSKNAQIKRPDYVEIAPTDAAQLGVQTGDTLRITSENGQAFVPAIVTDHVKHREVYATFQEPENLLNAVIGMERDDKTATPNYKVTQVRIEKV